MRLDCAKLDAMHLHDSQQIVAKSDHPQAVYPPLWKRSVDFAATLPGSQNDRPNDAWAGHSFDKSGHMFANSGYHTGPPSLVDQILLHNPNR